MKFYVENEIAKEKLTNLIQDIFNDKNIYPDFTDNSVTFERAGSSLQELRVITINKYGYSIFEDNFKLFPEVEAYIIKLAIMIFD